MPIYRLEQHRPQIAASAWVAPSADIIGHVSVAEQASIWFGAVLRGDVEPISIGAGSNIQDGAVLHSDAGFPCVVHENVTVGHRAIVHGATLHHNSLVGMGAILLNGSSLGEGAILAAGALLKEGDHVPAGMLAVGIPAKVIKPVGAMGNAERYQIQKSRYQQDFERLD